MASIAVCGGDTALAERWWRRAQAAANASGDALLAAYVTGQRAVHALNGGSVVRSLTLADYALRTATAPCVGRMQAGAAKAQASALLGRKREAREALRALEQTFERLPRDITHLIDLAEILIQRRQIDEAIAIATQVAAVAACLDSGWVNRDFRALHAQPYANDPAVREFLQRQRSAS